MKKLFEWLSKNADKALHFAVCVLIVLCVTKLDMAVWHRDIFVAMAIGGITAMCLSVAKEAIDFFRGEDFDSKDLMSDFAGTIGGMLLALLFFLV